MPVKIVSDKSLVKLNAGEISLEMLTEMVNKYRDEYKYLNHPRLIRYSTISLKEILTMCRDNNVVSDNDKISEIINGEKGKEFGIKVYLGKHYAPETYPKIENTENPDIRYKDIITTIFCNVKKNVLTGHWEDMLEVGNSASGLNGVGYDRVMVCPQECGSGILESKTDVGSLR